MAAQVANTEMAKFYTEAMDAKPVSFWNSSEAIDAYRNIRHVLGQKPNQIVFGSEGSTPVTAGRLAQSIDHKIKQLRFEHEAD